MSRIVIICGSHRQNSQSRRIANYLKDRCHTLLSSSADIMDIAELSLPLWDQEVWNGGEPWKQLLPPIHAQLTDAEGYLIIAPEWGGMAPPGLKNLLLLCSQEQVGHKPAMLVGVSAARGGAYPISELRSSGYKNNKIVVMPDHLIIRDCEKMLQTEQAESEDDEFLRRKIDWALQVLDQYMQSFLQLRRDDKGILFQVEHKNGM